MRCEICLKEVPPERVNFLLSEGRQITCIACQRNLEEEGQYRTYRGLIVSDKKEKYYDFIPTKENLPSDPFLMYKGRGKFIEEG